MPCKNKCAAFFMQGGKAKVARVAVLAINKNCSVQKNGYRI
jgi:hypothetical protein